MKIRNGFVSNSSSSSFIVLGIERNGDYEDIMENETLPEGIDTLYVEGSNYEYVSGYIISDVSDDGDYLEEQEIPIDKLFEMATKISETFNVEPDKVKLLIGTRPS